MQLETFVREKWYPVVRYNYSHGYPHRDLVFIDGRRLKEKIDETNLAKVVTAAVDDLKQNWMKYLRRGGYAEE